ncbi:MAG: CHRD domain-containing protein [Saprospiraceae bacterium]|nr:CHRD domain-containing protein [Saprospiraceae bacterium]
MKLLFFFVYTLSVFFTSSSYGQWSEKIHFSGIIDSTQSGVSSPAIGLISLSYNTTFDTACVDISVNGLSGPITSIHIHEGSPGTFGGVVADLSPFLNGNRITGSISNGLFLEKLLKGLYYVSVHTQANPTGEIRGQIWPDTDYMYRSSLDTTLTNPTIQNGENPIGLATFRLGKSQKWMHVRCITNNLTGSITAAHLHIGSPDTIGAIMVDLTSMLLGNSIVGTFDASAINGLWDSLEVGSLYLNIYTTNNPAGEICGQLIREKKLSFDSQLDTTQHTHIVNNIYNSQGLAYVYFSWDLDTMWYDIVVDSLSGPIISSNISEAPIGSTGQILYDLSANINGNRVQGFVTDITNLDALKMLRGETYFNILTNTNPNGEIRGQIYKYARNGYNMTFDGNQQVPPINVNGVGSGIISVDRDMTNAHISLVYSDLSGSTVNAYLQNASFGNTGPVIYDLTSWITSSGTNGSAFGYWDSSDVVTPFNSTYAGVLWSEGMYINIYTSMNSTGEIRGQAETSTACDKVNTSSELLEDVSDQFQLYPNPVGHILYFNLIAEKTKAYNICIHNSLGESFYTKNVTLYEGENLLDINIGEYTAGVYFITLRSNSHTYTKKIVKY